jgi:hypothetical protein
LALAQATLLGSAALGATKDDGGFAAAADALIRLFTEPLPAARHVEVAVKRRTRRAPAVDRPVFAARPAPAPPAARPRPAAMAEHPVPVVSDVPRAVSPSARPHVAVALPRTGAQQERPPLAAGPPVEIGLDADGNPAVSARCESGWTDSCRAPSPR